MLFPASEYMLLYCSCPQLCVYVHIFFIIMGSFIHTDIYIYMCLNVCMYMHIYVYTYLCLGFPGGSVGKESPAMQETWV